MIQITPKHDFNYDGVTIRIFHANKGEGLPKHSHIYSHATFCSSGSCLITKANKSLVVDKKSQPVNLLGVEWHEIEALEDNTVFINVFAEGKY